MSADLDQRIESALENQRRRVGDNNIEVEGPFGTRARIPGRQITSFLLLVAVVVGVGYLINQHDTRAAEAMGKIQTNQQLLAEHMDEMIYVMSLSEPERAKLNIAMPDSLLKKTRR